MLIGNYAVLNKTPGRWLAGNSTAGNAHPNSRANWGTSGPRRGFALQDGEVTALVLLALPTGYTTGWMMPLIAGDMSSHYNTVGVSTLAGAMAAGINISGVAPGSTTGTAVGNLIVSASGQAFGSTTLSGNIVASLAASGTASGTTSTTAILGAIAWGNGVANGSNIATLVSYATGRLVGSVTPFTVLSPENLAAVVWDSPARTLTPDGVSAIQSGLASGLTIEQYTRLKQLQDSRWS